MDGGEHHATARPIQQLAQMLAPAGLHRGLAEDVRAALELAEKLRPRTTCLYSAASMLLRSLSAVSQSFASNPRLAPPLETEAVPQNLWVTEEFSRGF